MTNTQRFAERELTILSKSATDPNNRPIIEPFRNEILALCEAFGNSGQSGGSAPYTATALSQAIKKLCLKEPICPITGIDEEWTYIREMSEDDEMMYQNNRCSALFKGKSGKCWYLDAIVWKNENGMTYSGSAFLPIGTAFQKILSRQYVKSFPFTPKTFYIDITEKEVAPGDWEFYVKSPAQLKKVFKYYDKY